MTMKLANLIDALPRSGPRYRAIAEAIAEGIASGALADGERLPPMRDLAYRLSVTTGTVARAYALAATHGHVGGEVGRGTYIRAGIRAGERPKPARGNVAFAAAPRPTHIPMKANLPADIGQAKILAEELSALALDVAASSYAPAFDYLPTGGAPAHREAGAQWMTTGGFAPSPENVILCSGAQQAILISILAATEPGDLILTEGLTYHAIINLASMTGRRIAPVALDAEGLVPEALAEACATLHPRALFTVPTLHNPTTATMSAALREEIAGIAAAHRLAIIEDDIYANLLEERPLPLAHLLPAQSWYVNGLSKAIAPGLRIAYVQPPRDKLDRARAMTHGLGHTVPPIMAELATRILLNGVGAQLVARQRKEIAARNAIAATRLHGAALRQHPAAMQAWLQLPDAWRAGAFADAARARGLLIGAGEEFMVGQPDRAARHVRLCLGAPTSRFDLEQGLGIIAELQNEAPLETAVLA